MTGACDDGCKIIYSRNIYLIFKSRRTSQISPEFDHYLRTVVMID